MKATRVHNKSHRKSLLFFFKQVLRDINRINLDTLSTELKMEIDRKEKVEKVDADYKDEEEDHELDEDDSMKKRNSIVGIDLWGRKKRGQKRLDFETLLLLVIPEFC